MAVFVLQKLYINQAVCKVYGQHTWCELPAMLTRLNKENIKHPAGDSHVFPPLPRTDSGKFGHA